MTDMNFSPNMWEKVDKIDKDKEKIARPSMTYWQDAWRRLKGNNTAMIGLVLVIIVFALAIFGPMIVNNTYDGQDLDNTNQTPTAEHWMGTDGHGRDLFVRVLYGGRVSLEIAVIATIVNFVIGVLYGGIAGYIGGRVDNVMMRLVDIISTIPLVLYAIMIMIIFKNTEGVTNIVIAIGLVYWVRMARIVRGQMLSLREQEFVLAAKTLGADTKRILMKHLIPNAMGPIIVTLTMMIPSAIFTEAFLSFIGLGVSAPMASWGSLASDALTGLRSYPYQLFFPAAAICVTMFGFNLFGDGLSDALDPKQRK